MNVETTVLISLCESALHSQSAAKIINQTNLVKDHTGEGLPSVLPAQHLLTPIPVYLVTNLSIFFFCFKVITL